MEIHSSCVLVNDDGIRMATRHSDPIDLHVAAVTEDRSQIDLIPASHLDDSGLLKFIDGPEASQLLRRGKKSYSSNRDSLWVSGTRTSTGCPLWHASAPTLDALRSRYMNAMSLWPECKSTFTSAHSFLSLFVPFGIIRIQT